jgi:hypothetical protein
MAYPLLRIPDDFRHVENVPRALPRLLATYHRRVFWNALESPISRDALKGLVAKIEQKADSKHRSRSPNLISRSNEDPVNSPCIALQPLEHIPKSNLAFSRRR